MKISSHKRQYHPYIPLAFHLNILPEKATQQLPRSTRHYWRKKDLQQLAGYEFAIEQQDVLHTVAVIASNKYLLAVNKALIKMIAITRYITKYRLGIKSGRAPIINCLIKQINSIAPTIGLRKTLHWCKFLSPQSVLPHSPHHPHKKQFPASSPEVRGDVAAATTFLRYHSISLIAFSS